MQEMTLKIEALEEKQYLERLLVLYDAFQMYVEALTPYVKGKAAGEELIAALERFRLKFEEYETLFLEWHDGEQTINAGGATFLTEADSFYNNEDNFRFALLLATTKFQDILEKRGRSLRELHEKIALVEGQSKAEEITHVPSSALTKLKDADTVAEIASKWMGRAVKFAPWALELLKNLHH